jgi:DNA-binding GntR family transcriptional regulator
VPATKGASAERDEVRSGIYADILGKIMTGKWPPGRRLVEEELAQAYHVSRTPIREILFALEKDGIIERSRNRGAKVVSFTPDDVEEIYEIRKTLECLAVRNAVRNLQLNDLLSLERRLEELRRKEKAPKWNHRQAELDLELHRLIVSSSGNRRLAAYLENLSLLIQSLRLVGYRNDQHARRAGEEHLAIVRALLRRDPATAEQLLADHIETSKRNALELFFWTRSESEGLALREGAGRPESGQAAGASAVFRCCLAPCAADRRDTGHAG